MDGEDTDCMCDFPLSCQGDGVLSCTGCGGDFCVCHECFGQGTIDCDGCEMCEPRREGEDLELGGEGGCG
jgi:hypothetical protein